MKLYIKYMVSLRCKMIVREELMNLGLKYILIDLGMVEVLEDINEEQHDKLKENLLRSGLELLDDKRSILIDKIKNVIIEMIHYSDELPKIRISSLFIKSKR
jgi:hypothetical protein